MRIFILYDSVFGHTEKIARAMACPEIDNCRVDHVPVRDWPGRLPPDVTHFVVGSPTRQFRATRLMTSLLRNLDPGSLKGIHGAAFDTRIDLDTINSTFLRFVVNRGGYAAPGLARQLVKLGAPLSIPPEGFFVTGEEGPLKKGEIGRAYDWMNRFILLTRQM